MGDTLYRTHGLHISLFSPASGDVDALEREFGNGSVSTWCSGRSGSVSRVPATEIQNLVVQSVRDYVAWLVICHRMGAAIPNPRTCRLFTHRGGLLILDSQLALGNGTQPVAHGLRQQATKFQFVLNLKVARALGLVVPTPIMLRVDELIE